MTATIIIKSVLDWCQCYIWIPALIILGGYLIISLVFKLRKPAPPRVLHLPRHNFDMPKKYHW